MPQIGGDTEQMMQLASTFNTASGEVETLVATLGSALESTWWIGPAADNFRSTWEGSYLPVLRNLQNELLELQAQVSGRESAILQAGS